MKNEISLTLPMDATALRHASIMLDSIARELDPPTSIHTDEYVEPPLEVRKEILKEEGFDIAITDPIVETPVAEDVFAPSPIAEAASQAVQGVLEEIAEVPSVDSRGMPWDERIHASTKTQNANGQWKNKRGVDKALLESVEAEMLGTTPVRADTTVEPDPAPAPTPAPTEITTFAQLMQAVATGGLEPLTVTNAVKSVGLESLPLLATRPDLIPAVVAVLGL